MPKILNYLSSKLNRIFHHLSKLNVLAFHRTTNWHIQQISLIKNRSLSTIQIILPKSSKDTSQKSNTWTISQILTARKTNYHRKSKSDPIQLLDGESLKKISEETQIPKRNLIRWKH